MVTMPIFMVKLSNNLFLEAKSPMNLKLSMLKRKIDLSYGKVKFSRLCVLMGESLAKAIAPDRWEMKHLGVNFLNKPTDKLGYCKIFLYQN